MWVPGSRYLKLVRIAQVLEKVPTKVNQAIISYVCCVAGAEQDVINEDLAKDGIEPQEMNMKIPHRWKKYYTLVGADNSDLP